MAQSLYSAECELCPRRCKVDRNTGQKGHCGAADEVEIFRYGPHHGEEPPISGARGSGTVFFTRCTLNCIYCQNYPFSQLGKGSSYSVQELCGILGGLRDAGCHNWNLVSPTPWLPGIKEALVELKSDGVSLPVVYNSSGFERVETLRRYSDVADVYLVDLRYARAQSAKEGSGTSAYIDRAREAVTEMWRQKGPLECDDSGIALKGTVCRLLVLPGKHDEAVQNLKWLDATFGKEIAVSVMFQYLPTYRAVGMEDWGRRPDRDECEEVRSALDEIRFLNGWVQEYDNTAPADLIGFEMEQIRS